MGERYFVTGVQLGMLIAMEIYKDRENLVEEIIDHQFIGNTNCPQTKPKEFDSKKPTSIAMDENSLTEKDKTEDIPSQVKKEIDKDYANVVDKDGGEY